ncbi:hypothetical protein HG535_0D02450 [Zygotorulaspora mrakii]|uniref:tRNA (adenine(58)-N(1))-methyltransferase non-catalytic subunit TRM6 n=1 Tax=Zygotorulaspora mrakii TaxID=42260 RepID=A0A7H9B217_ZYGMR|nr:uncharacterized protein HG535_0D02450 [Zygotorulaspora mrakii]QLG72537.1 hypothetical protein HG535_0D02450 [Zygotorulaspora mrakii]
MNPNKRLGFNQHVILRLPSNNFKIVELKPDGSISLGKFGAFYTNDIVGYPLGTTFEIYYDGSYEPDEKNKNRTPIGKVRVMNTGIDQSDLESTPTPLPMELTNKMSSATNKELINIGNEIQGMTMEEIESLKKQSATHAEIISKMIESHGSFHKKTVYSQEKYLNRKKQKFSKFFTAEYLSSSAMLQFLLEKGDVQRVMDLSQESIGMLLNLGNIRSNGQYLCVDETGGLLVYAMLERMFGGQTSSALEDVGSIVVIHENEHPNLDLLKFSNYSDQFIKNHVKAISLLDFFEPPIMEEVKQAFKPLSKEEISSLKSGKKNAYYRRLKWYNTQLQTIELSKHVEYDGLIIASTLHLPTLVRKLGRKVHGSRPIVCYSQFKETLLELTHVLYKDLNYLAPSIYETRCRPFQSIRGKLHPLMTMRGGGGYLMWCHRVIPAPDPPTNLETTNGNGTDININSNGTNGNDTENDANGMEKNSHGDATAPEMNKKQKTR